MHYCIEFESGMFDLDGEKENPINPFPGISIGEWLSPLLVEKGTAVTEIEPEDWGWYLIATMDGRNYLVGFVGDSYPYPNWNGKSKLTVQIDKYRTFKEWLTFKNKMDERDDLLILVRGIIEKIEDVEKIEITKIV